MYQNKKVLAIIPARGGSKGIPHKNIISLCGKPLIAYTIEAANQSTYIDTVIVSTDDVDIQRISEQYGALVPFLREAKIASDEATTISVVVDAVKRLEVNGEKFDVVILLQPTSPLRTAEEIDPLERKITNIVLQKHNVYLSGITIYSMNTKNEDIAKLRYKIYKIVMSNDGVLEFHGFYLEEKNKSIRFDIIIDYSIKNREEIYNKVLNDVKKEYPDYTINIKVDIDI